MLPNARTKDIGQSGKKRPTIGLFIENTSDMSQGYYPVILDGVMRGVQECDANLLCFIGGSFYGVPDMPFDAHRNILYDIASEDCLDGLIIVSSIGNFASQEEVKNLYARYKPLPTVTLGTPIDGTVNITVDHKKGMYDLLVHLIEVHHYRRIAFIRGPVDSLDAQIRYEVYQEVLAEYGIPLDPNLVVMGHFRFVSGSNAVRVLLDERQVDFDVIVGANDHMALGALGELQSRGFMVPYDVAVAGFDNINETKNVVPPLTTVRQPLLQLGAESVRVLMVQIAQEGTAEQMIFPTELIVRRSCGCLGSKMPPIEEQVRERAEVCDSLVECLTSRREDIIQGLVQSVDFATMEARKGAAQLLDSFVDEVVYEANGRFLEAIDQLLRTTMRAKGDVASWQAVVRVLRRHITYSLGGDVFSLRAGTLLYEAQVFITGEIRNIEAQRYLQMERQNWLLHEIGQLLITMFDLEGLMEIIAKSMPRLGIPSCYLALYEDPQPYSYPQSPPAWSRLVLACNENGRIPLDPAAQRFPTRSLLPARTLPQNRRFTMIIEPLYFREEHIGFVLLERGPREGNVYEVLRGQIASALKGALLLQAHKQAEAELRQHRDHLDDLVQERTTELAAANENLRQEVLERRQTEISLQQSQRNLAYAQTIAQLGYSYWNIATEEFVWSDELYRIFEVEKGKFEISGKAVKDLIHPNDWHMFIEAEESRQRGESTQQLEFRLIGPQGNVRKYIYLWGETTFADDGKPMSVFSIFQDVTVRRLAELKLEAYTAELERSNKELQDFAYVASHDLQEPLRKIQVFGERLQQRYGDVLDEKGQNYIARMQNAAERMQALIIDLLAFSRVRTHSQPFEKVDLARIVAQVMQDLEIGIAEIGATITVSELPVLEADPTQMRQLFQNLLGNTLKFQRPDVPLQVTVSCRLAEPFYEITVADNGIGFEPQYAERIFNVFERLHGRESYAGTGMGLAICRRIAERHRGDIHAESQPGEGAVFTVRLPLSQPSERYIND